AIAHGIEMVEQGAAILDVGGESTRPNAAPVPADEELRRVIPVIERLRDKVGVPISIDTRKVSVARAAVDAGASIVNDTLGEAGSIADVAAETGAAIAVMHSRGTPQTMRSLTEYSDVVEDVRRFLADKGSTLEGMGIASDSIVLDPGFGFAKTPQQNLALLNHLERVVDLGYPLLAGTSRKSFIGAVLDLPEDQRVEGTIATVVIAIAKGARIVRVHDVEPVRRAIYMVEAISSERVDVP
ncbi:MAG: dihydropteroate synthase, partial [Actinobacteria bacterium]|nr:dihydropteroate synthase [Actinomycetota bacterium]